MTCVQLSERRRSQRFGLKLPLDVVRVSNREVSVVGKTRNMSSSGAYFIVRDDQVAAGSPIEFVVTLRRTDPQGEQIRLQCRGRVTRLEKVGTVGRQGVAATIDRYQFLRGA